MNKVAQRRTFGTEAIQRQKPDRKRVAAALERGESVLEVAWAFGLTQRQVRRIAKGA